MKEKINIETATADFERFCEAQCIEIDVNDLDADDKEKFEEHKNRIIKAIQNGIVAITEEGIAEVNIGEKNPLKFEEPDGAVLLKADKAKAGEDMHALYNMLGEMCGVNPVTFSKMKISRCKICIAFGVLFLGS